MARDIGGFGRLAAPPDARDLRFLMRSQMPIIKALTNPKPRKRAYSEGPQLNQGPTPQCVGYSGLGFLNAAPLMNKHVNARPGADAEAVRCYRGAQDNDEWPGNQYDGSSVRGLMKYLVATGEISSYVWGQTQAEAAEWTDNGYGTIISGSNWYAEMDNVDSKGIIQEPSSFATPIGGHAYRHNWFDPKLKLWLVRNSWGFNWGMPKRDGTLSGFAYMTPRLFDRLQKDDGELAAATQVRLKAIRV